MGAYTNVHIPDQFDSFQRQLSENALLKFQLEQANNKINYLHEILNNIPAAIEQYGYVDLIYERGKKEMKIIKATTEQEHK